MRPAPLGVEIVKSDEMESRYRLVLARQFEFFAREVLDGIDSGLSAAAIIEKRFGFKQGEYTQDMRQDLMAIVAAFAEAKKNEEQSKRERSKQKEWLRKKLCKSCMKTVEAGF